MNPEMMKMAMDSMSRLTPAQMAEMQRQMASLPPGFLEQQMEAMKGMSPDVLQQQMAAANCMNPAAMEQQLKGAAAMARQQEDYQVVAEIFTRVRASIKLKEEGNQLYSAQKTVEAIEEYQRAKSNLSGHASHTAIDIRSKCMLNLASCYLRLNNYEACISECSEVLKTEPGNMKALYRRGQAHLALNNQAAAAADLRRALRWAPETDKPLIQKKLREAEDGLVTIEENPERVTDREHEGARDAMSSADLSAKGPAAAALPSRHGFPMDPSQMSEILRGMQDNSGMLEQARMSGGLPQGMEISPEAMRPAMEAMAGMDQKDLGSMMPMMQASIPGTSGGTLSQMGPDSEQFKQAAAALQANPELMSHAMKMFGQMDPQQLAAMSASMSAAGQGGQPSAAAMSEMLADPQSAKMMKEIMSNLTSQQLVSMSEAAGQQLTPEQAEMMSSKVKNLSDKQVELLLKGASWLNRGASLAQQTKAKVLQNKLLVLGILLLLVAVFLRYFNLV